MELRQKYKRYSKSSITCFNFHQVAEIFDAKIHSNGTFTSTKKFEEYIQYIKKEYNIIDISTALELQKSKMINDKYACITFDDGDKSIEKTIPYLDSEMVYASYYLNTAYLDNTQFAAFNILTYLKSINAICPDKILEYGRVIRHSRDRELYLETKSKILAIFEDVKTENLQIYTSMRFLESVNSKYIHFGLHGHEHDRFILLTHEEQLASLKENKRILEKLDGFINVFAIPFGRVNDWNYHTIQACNELNLDFLFANGGINYGDEVGFKRVPADNRNLIFDIRLRYFQ